MASTAPSNVGNEAKDSKRQRRLELRSANLAAWERGTSPEGLGKLDTSLKRHTALLVKLRSSLNTAAQIPAILKDIAGLSLEKYVEEAVGAIVEGLGKCKTGPETTGAVEVVSAFHQRFPVLFTPPFSSLLLQGLKPGSSSATDKDIKEKEDSARVIKQRGLLRIVGELELVGILRKENGKGSTGDVTWNALKELLTSDREALALVAPLAIAFAKHLGSVYLPPIDNKDGTATNAQDFPALQTASESSEVDEIVSRDMKEKFRKLMVAYFEVLGKKEQKLHLELQKQDKRNHEAYIRSGEVFEDREKSYEKAVKSWERGWASVTQLAELLGLPVPTLPSLQNTLNPAFVTSGAASGGATSEELGPQSLWADEEEKKFYEELRELRGEVPASILGVPEDDQVAEEKAEDTVEEKPIGEETAVPEEDLKDEEMGEAAELDAKKDEESAADSADPALPAGPAVQLTALLARLPEASSKTTIDAIAFDFAFLNSKAARKRLVKVLGSVSRNRQDILPYYARLVGTLNPYMPDVGKDLVAVLDEEFRYLQRKRNVDLAETRSKNMRFFAELTKFRVTPIHVILHILKVLLDDFSGPNIDNFCTLLEGCGRFLLRSEATSEKMRQVIEIYKRKKATMHLDQRQLTMLENAYYQCDPPDRPAIAPKERSPMQLYIRHLFYNVLTRNSSDKVLKLVRKLHWEDPAIVRKLHNAFVKVWKIKYSNVHLFAVLLYDLGRYHPDFSVSVIDDVLENIRVGMENNNFKYNQQRVATIKYLGELYNYRVIDSRLIFDTLWSLVTFGHPEGRPWPDVASPIDGLDDCFRVRLVCTLLDTCGSCFDRGSLKRKLDNFLVFFQLYVLTKGTLPMDVGFMYADTMEQLRPKMTLYRTFPEASNAVDEMMAAVSRDGPADEEVDENDGREGPREGADEEGDEVSESEDESEEESDEDEDAPADDFDEEEAGESRGRDPNAMTQDEEDEFARELAKMMVSNNENRKVAERKPVSLDVGLPLIRRSRQETEEDVDGDEVPQKKGMQFTLLTKKGNKQQALSMEIPLDSSIAQSTTLQREQNKAEQEQLKRLVLDYESREEAADKAALKESLARRGIVLNYGADNRRKGVKVQVVP
ncbi:hypothetical protein JCM5350_005782 [Sporobolomyces pararoseus]